MFFRQTFPWKYITETNKQTKNNKQTNKQTNKHLKRLLVERNWLANLSLKINKYYEEQGDRDDAQEITAFWKYIILNRKSLSNK